MEYTRNFNLSDLINHKKVELFLNYIQWNPNNLSSTEIEDKRYQFVNILVTEIMNSVEMILHLIEEERKQITLVKKFICDLETLNQLLDKVETSDLKEFYIILSPFISKRLNDVYEDLDQMILLSDEIAYRRDKWKKD